MYSAKTEMHRNVCRKKLLYHLCRIHERGVHGVFLAPLITDTVVFIVVIWMMCSEFRRMDHWKNCARFQEEMN